MNIHEYQAKNLLKEFGATVPEGFVIYNTEELTKKIKTLKTKNFVIKAQIHAGGRGKAGGIKLVKNSKDLIKTLDYLKISRIEFFDIVEKHRNNEIWKKSGNRYELINKLK